LNCASDNGNLPGYCQVSLHGIFNGAVVAMVFRALQPRPVAYFRLASLNDRKQLRFVSDRDAIPTDRQSSIDVSRRFLGEIVRDRRESDLAR